jgi:hypothetical protein
MKRVDKSGRWGYNIYESGGVIMGYETKVILKAAYEAAKRCASLEEALKVIASMANVEEVILEEDDKTEKK